MRRWRVWLDVDPECDIIGLGVDQYDQAGQPDRLWVKPVGPFDTEWLELKPLVRALVDELSGQGTLF